MRFLIWMLLIYCGYKLIVSMIPKNNPAVSPKGPEAEATYRDPVCGVYVSEQDAVVGRLNDERHYFCSMDCLDKFREQLDTPNNGGNA